MVEDLKEEYPEVKSLCEDATACPFAACGDLGLGGVRPRPAGRLRLRGIQQAASTSPTRIGAQAGDALQEGRRAGELLGVLGGLGVHVVA